MVQELLVDWNWHGLLEMAFISQKQIFFLFFFSSVTEIYSENLPKYVIYDDVNNL